MATRVNMLVVGDAQPREVWITRTIALRVFCDCFKHASTRPSWVFLVALDRDEVKAYTRRADSPESAPWRELDTHGPVELQVCGTRLSVAQTAEEEAISLAVAMGELPESEAPLPWWHDHKSSAEQAEIWAREKAEETKSAEYEARLRAGQVDGYEPEAPREGRSQKRKQAWKQRAMSFGGAEPAKEDES